VKPIRAELSKARRRQAGALTGFWHKYYLKQNYSDQQSKKIAKIQKKTILENILITRYRALFKFDIR